jgi:predicted nucleic acid-binding protein
LIAVDTSTLIAFLAGEAGDDVEALDHAIQLEQAVLPPVVLTEILSGVDLEPAVSQLLQELPVLEVEPGYWVRAAAARRELLARKLRARLADTLVAQSCVDHRSPLITRDADFRHFAEHAGLRLVVPV